MLMQRKRGNNFSALLLILLIAGLGLVMLLPKLPIKGITNSHASRVHAADYQLAKNCFRHNPILKSGFNPDTNRMMEICSFDEDGELKFAVRITEKIDGEMHEVTLFIKNKMSCIDQVIQYMKNTGYTETIIP